jgi:hypothetical protein
MTMIEYSHALVDGPNPSVYLTQVFNQTRPTGTTITGVPSGWSKTITTHGGMCIVDLNFTAYTVAQGGFAEFALQIDNWRSTSIKFVTSTTSCIEAMPANFTIKYLEPGEHKFEIVAVDGNVSFIDSNCSLNMRVTEFSDSLIGNQTPTVNCIEVCNSTVPFSNSRYLRGGTDQTGSAWLNKQFITYGGIYIVHLSFTAYSTSGGPANFALMIDDNIKLILPFAFNTANCRKTISASFISSSPAGSHTIGLYVGWHEVSPGDNQKVLADGYDNLSLRIIEFSPSLTSGVFPTIPTYTNQPTYVGCYNDIEANRVFSNMVDYQTVNQCNDIAKTAHSPYFGMQNWQENGGGSASDIGECWYQAGSTLDRVQSLGSVNNCVIGNTGNRMGGSNTNAIYKTNMN